MGYTIELTGKHALITGASDGLGRHFAKLLAAAGASVTLAARRLDALEDACREIAAAGGTAHAVAMDVTDEASIAAAVESACASTGAVDILVNNAGVAVPKPFLELTAAEWDRVLDTNLRGAFLVGQAVARRMRDGGRGGAIVNVASILGFRVAGMVSAYAASKAGLIQLTEAMALELARHGIRVNALCPGYTETNINRAFFETEAGQAMIRRIPQRRLGQMSDLEGALMLLVSDAGSAITGVALPVDGGHLTSSL